MKKILVSMMILNFRFCLTKFYGLARVYLVVFIVIFTNQVVGKVISVPGDCYTIQLAINAAKPGDTVLVAEGIYYEQINFLGKKPLMVASEFLFDRNPSHISKTIIDGSRLQNPNSASVVNFISGEDTTSIICGFTIQHGRGTYSPDNMNDVQGGGIWISGSGAKIICNRITHNTLDDSKSVNGIGTSGAGIGSRWENSEAWIVIENNSIDSNTCISNYEYAFGAGISTSCNTRISNNYISFNTSAGISVGTAHGGGIGCGKDPSWATPVLIIIEQNTITNNLSLSESNLANSAAVFISDVPVIFENNEISFNKVETAVYSGGVPGVYLYQPGEGSVVRNTVFKGNTTNRWGGALGMQNDAYMKNQVLIENNYFLDNSAQSGAALLSFNVPVKIQNNVFSGNRADNGGATFFRKRENLPVTHLAVLINNSFSGNTAFSMGGALYSINSKPLIINSIFSDNHAREGPEIYADTIELAYTILNPSLIFGELVDGGGNFPGLVTFSDSVLLTLSAFTDCENLGTLTYTCHCGEKYFCPKNDITGAARPLGSIVDFGAYEFENKCLPVEEPVNGIKYYPNPFTTHITFEYTLKESSQVDLLIYNSLGQLMSKLVNSYQLYGEKKVEWNTDDFPPGIYYCRFGAGDYFTTGKIIKAL